MSAIVACLNSLAPWLAFVSGLLLTLACVLRQYRKANPPVSAGCDAADRKLVKTVFISQLSELLAIVLPFLIVFAYSVLVGTADHVLEADELSLAAAVLYSQAAVRIHHLAWKAPAAGTEFALAKSTGRLLALFALSLIAITPIAAATNPGANVTVLKYTRIIVFCLATYLFMTWGSKASLAAAVSIDHGQKSIKAR